MIIESNSPVSGKRPVNTNNIDAFHYTLNDLYIHLEDVASAGDILTIASLEQMGQYNVLYTVLSRLIQSGCRRLGYMSCSKIGMEILAELGQFIESDECYAYHFHIDKMLGDDDESYEELQKFGVLIKEHNLKMIVIDSLCSAFWDRTSSYNMATKLKKFASEFGVTLIIVSEVWREEDMSEFVDPHIDLQQVSYSCLNLISDIVMTVTSFDTCHIHEDEKHYSLHHAIDVDVYHSGHLNKDRIRLQMRDSSFALVDYEKMIS